MPERVPGRSPARSPAVDTSWQGNPPTSQSTGSTSAQSIVVTSPWFGTSGQWWARTREASCAGRGFCFDGGSCWANQTTRPPTAGATPSSHRPP